MQKSYTIKIYNLAGTYLKTQNPITITKDVRFSSTMNGGQGQCVIELGLKIDDFDEGNTIDHMRFVRIYEQDDVNSQTPRLIYTGFVSQYVPFFRNGTEGVRLVLLGLVSLLSRSYYKSGTNFTVSAAGIDPAQVMKNIIDHFNSVYGGSWIGYSGGNVDTVGTSVTYDFVEMKWLDALKKAHELAGSDRWWAVREDGQLWFQAKPGTPTHRFTLGHDVESGEVVKNNEQIINKYQLRWGGGPTVTDYSDSTSISTYGTRERVESDPSIGDLTTANQKGNQTVQDNKNPKVQAKLRINTRYDIETIKPGDTCSVLNNKNGTTLFPTNMQITAVSYSPDGVDIDLENTRTTFAQNFADAVQEIV